MPRIPEEIIDTSIYLYRSVDDAEKGRNNGGSGFLISYPSEQHPEYQHVYAVTNSHIIREGAATTIRLNNQEGLSSCIPTQADKWSHHFHADDIAVYLIPDSLEKYKYQCLSYDWFITDDIMKEWDIGLGDEVFSVGRLIKHDGEQKNTPSVRFGNISLMPTPIRHPRQMDQESFVVEARSMGGLSGSPVFVYVIGGIGISLENSKNMNRHILGQKHLSLLGINWGHYNHYEPLRSTNENAIPPACWGININTSLMYVVPAWKLAEFIRDDKELIMGRKDVDNMISEQKASNSDKSNSAG